MISRSEGAGLTVALIGHIALFGVLSVGFLATPNPLKLRPEPIEVALVDDVGLESSSPNPTSEPPAAKLSPVEAPIEPQPAPPEPAPNPQPVAKPEPAPPKPAPVPDAVKPAPRTPPKTAPAQAPARPAPSRPVAPTGRLDGILNGLSDKPSASKSTTPPAATAGPEVKAALGAAIIRQIRPHWAPPSGADSDKLRTTVTVRLNEDGSLASEPRVTQQTGVTDSNRAQADLARERAIRAVKLAAPFKLPPQFYDAWKVIAPVLYEDL